MSRQEATAAQYLNWLATMVIDLEKTDDCVGATAGHLKELMKHSPLGEAQTTHMLHFIKALDELEAQREIDEEFDALTKDLVVEEGDTE